MTELETLRDHLRDFARERDWEQFHSPKNLAMALSVEAAELVEVFQWLTEEQSRSLEPAARARADEEIAHVLFYLVWPADHPGIAAFPAAEGKLAANPRKYPADKARGNARKYDEL